MMALYLAECGGSDRLLVIGSKETNVDYVLYPSEPPKDVLLLSNRAFTSLVDSIKLRIA